MRMRSCIICTTRMIAIASARSGDGRCFLTEGAFKCFELAFVAAVAFRQVSIDYIGTQFLLFPFCILFQIQSYTLVPV